MYYKEFEPGSEIYGLNDNPNYFYYILGGQVDICEKNKNIQNWDWIKSIYDNQILWKQRNIDKKLRVKL